MLEIGVSARFRNFFLKMLDRTGDVENLDRAAVTANQIVLVAALAEAVMRGAAVETDAPDNASFLKAGNETVNGRRIAGNPQKRALADLLQGEGLPCFEEDFKTRFQRTGFPETRAGTLVEERV